MEQSSNLQPFGKKVIAFIGVIGSGKTYQSEKYSHLGFFRFAFADILKVILFDIFFPDRIYYKNKVDYIDNIKNQLSIAVSFAGSFLYLDFRQYIQNFATAIKNHLGHNIWVSPLAKIAEEHKLIVIPDCRFQNELEAILALEKKGFTAHIILTNFKSYRYDDKNPHSSEKLAQAALKLFPDVSLMKALTKEEILLLLRKSPDLC